VGFNTRERNRGSGGYFKRRLARKKGWEEKGEEENKCLLCKLPARRDLSSISGKNVPKWLSGEILN